MTGKMSIDDCSIVEILAYHEAGHAVAAWSMSVRLYEIGIDGNRGYVRDGLRWESLENMELGKVNKHAQILLSGELAERRLYMLHGSEFDQSSSMAQEDHEKVQELANHFFEEDPIKWVNEMTIAAEEILLNNWHRVEALAKALVKISILPGQAAEQIIDNAVL